MRFENRPINDKSIASANDDIPEELRNTNAALPTSLTNEQIQNELLRDDMYVQVEQFVTTFIENVTVVAYKAIKNKELDPNVAYHDFRQVLIYVRGLRLCMYDREVNEGLIQYFADELTKNTKPQDQNILHNYVLFFKEFYQEYFEHTHLSQQTKIRGHLREAMRQLEHDYGYEPKLDILSRK